MTRQIDNPTHINACGMKIAMFAPLCAVLQHVVVINVSGKHWKASNKYQINHVVTPIQAYT